MKITEAKAERTKRIFILKLDAFWIHVKVFDTHSGVC